MRFDEQNGVRRTSPAVQLRSPEQPGSWMNSICARGLLTAVAFVLVSVGPAAGFVPSGSDVGLEIPLPRLNFERESDSTVRVQAETAAAVAREVGGSWTVHSWNPLSRTPHLLYGSGVDIAGPLVDRDAAEEAAQTVIARLSSQLGVDGERLRSDGVTEGMGKYAAHFQQTYEGLDVIGGHVHTTFMASGRFFVAGSDFYQVEGLDPTPYLTLQEAETIATEDLPFDPDVNSIRPGSELLVLPIPSSEDQVEFRLVWKLSIETRDPIGVWVTHVDAHTGVIVWRYNDVHFVDYNGSTEGDVQPSTYCDGTQRQALGYIAVTIDGVGSTISDSDGEWTLENDDVTPRNATAWLLGPWIDVDRSSGLGDDAVFTGTATPATPLEIVFDDSNSRADERDVFDAVTDVRDFFLTFDPEFGYVNEQIVGNVGVPGSCNAFWDGDINFFNASDDCANTGEIQGVVHHEFGHGIQDYILGWQGNEGLGEANGDIIATLMTDESVIGRGFRYDCDEGIRDCMNSLQYPEDLTGEVHDDGRIMCGVTWGMRANMEASLGVAAAKLRTAQIWHFGRLLERPEYQDDQVFSYFVADDDDGDLHNGTPNYDAICEAVLAHDVDRDGFSCPGPEIWVEFSYFGSEDGTWAHPFNSVGEAVAASSPGDQIGIRAGETVETPTIADEVTIRAFGGVVVIGN